MYAFILKCKEKVTVKIFLDVFILNGNSKILSEKFIINILNYK